MSEALIFPEPLIVGRIDAALVSALPLQPNNHKDTALTPQTAALADAMVELVNDAGVTEPLTRHRTYAHGGIINPGAAGMFPHWHRDTLWPILTVCDNLPTEYLVGETSRQRLNNVLEENGIGFGPRSVFLTQQIQLLVDKVGTEELVQLLPELEVISGRVGDVSLETRWFNTVHRSAVNRTGQPVARRFLGVEVTPVKSRFFPARALKKILEPIYDNNIDTSLLSS